VGVDRGEFPSAAHLASGAGVCPRQRESAGKRRSGRGRKGNRWPPTALVQVAWAASHTNHMYLSAQYHRLASRRDRKGALLAVGHTILVMVYHLLKGGRPTRNGAGITSTGWTRTG
jgi:transposase